MWGIFRTIEAEVYASGGGDCLRRRFRFLERFNAGRADAHP